MNRSLSNRQGAVHCCHPAKVMIYNTHKKYAAFADHQGTEIKYFCCSSRQVAREASTSTAL